MGPQARADPEPSPVPGLAWPEWEVTASEAGAATCDLWSTFSPSPK